MLENKISIQFVISIDVKWVTAGPFIGRFVKEDQEDHDDQTFIDI